jgi:glycosyltransferase involved in cell wall biosynthesis
MEYSLVIPVYNEVESLPGLWEEIDAVMEKLNAEYEVLFVDDGSDDGSTELLKEFAHSDKSAVNVLIMPAHCGQTRALRAGLDAAGGKIVVTLDADLQNDPADIPKLVAKLMDGGYDCVCGWRRRRCDPWIKQLLSKAANLLQRRLTRLAVHDVSCTLRAYRHGCVSDIPLNWEGQHRFIALCLARQGYRIGEVETNHRPRRFGRSKYSHRRLFKVVIDFFRILTGQR